MAPAKILGQLARPTAIGFGIAESFAAVLLLVPKLCRWGAWLTGLMLVALMICIAYYFAILRGRFLS